MTLILTELSDLGVAMAADTAATNVILEKRSLHFQASDNHVTKLYPIRKLSAGISFYGFGKVGQQRTDHWLTEFIQWNESQHLSLGSFGLALCKELNCVFRPELNPELQVFPSGFHLAGFEESDNGGPAAYEIGSQTKMWGCLRKYPHSDCEPLSSRPLFTGGDPDLCKKAKELRNSSPMIRNIEGESKGTVQSSDDLRTRCEYLRSLFITVFQSNQDQRIPGPVTTLSISSKGIEDYETR
jgi:hypothetical protein